jgi:magnesium transporter
VKLNILNLGKEGVVSSQASSEMAPDWFTDDVIRWIDVTAPNIEEVEQLLKPLELHEKIRAAVAAPKTWPEVIAFEKLLFVRMPFLRDSGGLSMLRLVCGPTAIVSTRTSSLEEIEELAGTLQAGLRKVRPTVPDLLIEIIEATLRETQPAGLALREEVNSLSISLETRGAETTFADLLALKRRSSALACLIEDQLICVRELRTVRSAALSFSEVKDDLGALAGVLEQARPMALRLEDQARELRQGYAGLLQETTNRRLNVLAVLSAIYLPSTLIAGIYGMNFDDIPITKIAGGYYVVFSLMITLVVGQMVFFWRRGWFK